MPSADRCTRCRTRPPVLGGSVCGVCRRKREDDAQRQRVSRATRAAQRMRLPESLELDARQVQALVAAIRTLDAARDRVRVVDMYGHGDGATDVERAAAAWSTAVVAIGLADAWDDAVRLLHYVLPAATFPPPLGTEQERVRAETRRALGIVGDLIRQGDAAHHDGEAAAADRLRM